MIFSFFSYFVFWVLSCVRLFLFYFLPFILLLFVFFCYVSVFGCCFLFSRAVFTCVHMHACVYMCICLLFITFEFIYIELLFNYQRKK